ncbi:hypothetical protein ACWF9G_32560 [Nocardia sp. NPDC055029]
MSVAIRIIDITKPAQISAVAIHLGATPSNTAHAGSTSTAQAAAVSAESPDPAPPLRRWVNTKIAAAHIGIHPEVLRRWARQPGKHAMAAHAIRVGKGFRWDIDALETALASLNDQPQESPDETR